MAAEGGEQGSPLIRRLFAQPHRFEFVQAVRLLERLGEERANGAGPRLPVGHDAAPPREAVRFRAWASLGFPGSEIASLRDGGDLPGAAAGRGDAAPPEMTVTFLGLIGASGALPHHYTTQLIERLRNKDRAMRDFLDVFNHRAVSLFYRAWEKYRLPVLYERAKRRGSPVPDPFTFILFCLVGLGTDGLRGKSPVEDETYIFYGGAVGHAPRSAVGLELTIADYFGVPAGVEQLIGQWLELPDAARTLLPGRGAQGHNCCLGRDAMLGERVWDIQSKFRVRLGPLTYADFRRFIPSGEGLVRLVDMVKMFAGPEFDFEANPVLRADEAPPCTLGGGAAGARLGWNTFLSTRPLPRDFDGAVFSADAAAPATAAGPRGESQRIRGRAGAPAAASSQPITQGA